jgi:hypothetical protein
MERMERKGSGAAGLRAPWGPLDASCPPVAGVCARSSTAYDAREWAWVEQQGRLAWVGRKRGAQPVFKRNHFSFYFLNKTAQTLILSKKKLFFGHDPKIKVVQNFMLYNFALITKVRFLLDFELQN